MATSDHEIAHCCFKYTFTPWMIVYNLASCFSLVGPTIKPSNYGMLLKMEDEIVNNKNIHAKRQRRHPEDSSLHAVGMVIIYRTLGHLLPENYDPDRRSLR